MTNLEKIASDLVLLRRVLHIGGCCFLCAHKREACPEGGCRDGMDQWMQQEANEEEFAEMKAHYLD